MEALQTESTKEREAREDLDKLFRSDKRKK